MTVRTHHNRQWISVLSALNLVIKDHVLNDLDGAAPDAGSPRVRCELKSMSIIP